jgi:preprotein translocase subunit SecD
VTRSLLAGAIACVLGCAGLASDPSPFAGDGGLELGLRGSGATAERDASILAERFEDVGVEAEATVTASDQIALKLRGIDPSTDFRALLAPAALELAFPGGEALDNAAIADSRVIRSDFDDQPSVAVDFTDDGSERFCTLSGRYVEQPVAIRMDGESVSEPIIREAICGGTVMITMGYDQSFEARMQEAHGLASALRSKPLASTWTVDTENVFSD